MDDLTRSPRDTMIVRLDVLRVKVLGQEHLPQKIARTKFSKRKFYIELKVANTKQKTKQCEGSKMLEWNEAVTFTDVDFSSTFEAAVYAKRTPFFHNAVKVDGFSDSVISILSSSETLNTLLVVTRRLDSCPAAQLEFHIKLTTLASLAPDTGAAIRSIANPVQKLPGSRSPPIPTDVVSAAGNTAQTVGDVLLPVLQKIEPFCEIMKSVSELHPYAKIALSIVNGVYTILKNQLQRNDKIRDLFMRMDSFYSVVGKDLKSRLGDGDPLIAVLQRIFVMTTECCSFIQSYASDLDANGFVLGALKNSFSSTDGRIKTYCDTFDFLEQTFYKALGIETQNIVQMVAEYASLDDLPHVGGASLNAEGSCLKGTRIDIISDASNWIGPSSTSVAQQSILLLIGEAGTGKSAIASTIAVDFAVLGCSFGFKRGIQERCNPLNLFPTIARDLADFDDNFRRALCDSVGNKKALQTTTSLELQFQHFIKNPMASISRPVLVVIDALDECGDNDKQRDALIKLLTNPDKLPPNLRFFITSRSEDDILCHFKGANKGHILVKYMSEISSQSTSADISLYIRTRLIDDCQPKLKDIDDLCCQTLARISQGLFQWAFVACQQIARPPRGRTSRERYDKLVQSGADLRHDSLLDYLYTDVLCALFEDDEEIMNRFKSVLGVVLSSLEPLSLTPVKALHETLKQSDEPYDAGDILRYLGSLLSGVTDTNIPIRPLHTSFLDFLTDPERSKRFSVDMTQGHNNLLLASLRIMKRDLAFNICKLESSYVMNEDILDLPKRIRDYIPEHLSYSCRFWARHLDVASTNGMSVEISRQTRDLLEPFMNEKLLFWLEALSVLGGVTLAFQALAIVARVFKSSRTPNDSLLGCVTDIQKFLTTFASVIIISAPHIYISAVPFSPRRSWISQQYLPRLPRTLRVLNSPEDWPASQDVIQHSDAICDIAISTDGARIAGACDESGVFIWDTRTGLLDSGLLHCGGLAFRVAFSADGARVAYALFKETIGVWDVESGRNWTIPESIFGPHDEVGCLTFSSDGRKLIAGSNHGTVGIWDTSSGDASGAILYRSIMECHFDCISFLSHGGALACGCKGKTIEVCKWDATTLQLTEQPLHIEAESSVSAVGVSFDGRHVAAGLENGTICLWGLPEGTPIDISVSGSSRNDREVWKIAFTQDGSRFASAGASGASVDVWEITPTGLILEVSLQGHTKSIWGLAYSPDGRHLFSCSFDRTIRKWDAHSTNTPDPIIPQSTSSIVGVHISHDGTRIASVSRDGTVRLWDGASGTAIGSPFRLSMEVYDDIFHSAMSRDGTRIMAVSRGMVRLLDFKGCKQTERRIELDTDFESTGVFSADGSRIYITSGDRIHIIDVDTMEEAPDSSTGKAFPVERFYGPPVISPDGTQFAVLSLDTDETVRKLRILDSQTVEEVSLPMLLHSSDMPYRLCISLDFHYVAYPQPFANNIHVMCNQGGILQKAISLNFNNTACGCLVFLPYTTATLLASAHWSDIVIWDLVSCNPIIGPLRRYNSTACVTSMACLQDGMRLVAGYSDGKVLVWDVSVFDDRHSGNSVIPIVLSPEAAHALPHPEDILSPDVAAPEGYSEGNPINTVEMTEDGWIVGPEYRRLFWVPPELRALWPHRMRWDLTGGEERIQLDLSQFAAHGRRWTDCYVDSDVP